MRNQCVSSVSNMAPSQELALPVERELVCNHLPTIQKDEEVKTFVHTYIQILKHVIMLLTYFIILKFILSHWTINLGF